MKSLKQKMVLGFASGFGTGYLPYVPGTWGSLVGLAFAFLTASWSREMFFIFWLMGIPVAAWICDQAAQTSQQSDPGWIVWDEVWGMMAVYLWVPAHAPSGFLVGFVVFRILDILKPGPIRWAEEKIPGGWGILMDDIVAGLIGAVIFKGWVVLDWAR